MRRYPALFVMFFFFYSLTTSDAILKRTTAKVCDCAYADIEFAFRVFFFQLKATVHANGKSKRSCALKSALRSAICKQSDKNFHHKGINKKTIESKQKVTQQRKQSESMSGSSKPGVVLNCRTCTRACKQYKSLQDEIEIGPEGSTTLASMLNYCSNLSFEPQDGALMPQHICLHCLQLLEQAFNFKRMVIDSDELLRLGLEEVESNANANPNQNASSSDASTDNNQEYVMIELLGGELTESECDSASKPSSGPHDVGALVEAYSEQEPDHEEFVVEDVADTEAECEAEADTETEETLETLSEFQPADIEYVTIKSEYDSQVEDDDDIEVMDTPHLETVSEQMEIQMLEDHMVMMSSDQGMDEVIGEVEADDILDMERSEHLVSLRPGSFGTQNNNCLCLFKFR